MPRLLASFFALGLLISACGSSGRDSLDAGSVVGEDRDQSAIRSVATTAVPAPSTTAPTASIAATAEARTTMTAPGVPAPEITGAGASSAQPAASPSTSTTAPPTQTSPTGPTAASPAAAAAAPIRALSPQNWEPMANFGDVTLVHPSNRIERMGFHQSNNDGARQLVPSFAAVNPLVLESRGRGTGSRTAADVVVEPGTEIRSPVTGTVIRAGGYILYCEHNDDFAVIEPDAHPGWELKVLHINGVQVAKGDRVEAGVTVLAPAATQLPFDSQVDEFTAEPSWPHVHIELIDPSIPDRPSSGGGC